MNKKALATFSLILLIVASASYVIGKMSYPQTLDDTGGEVIGIGISLNQTTIDWGSLYPSGKGTPDEHTEYIRVSNDENYEVALYWEVNDLSPSAFFDNAVITSSIVNGSTLLAQSPAFVDVWFNLDIGALAPSGDFSFDIIITAETTL